MDYCLDLVTSKRDHHQEEEDAHNDKKEEECGTTRHRSSTLSATKRQLAFRLLQTVVHTMDFSETDALVARYDDFIQTLIEECQDFATTSNIVVSADQEESCSEDGLATKLMDADSKEIF